MNEQARQDLIARATVQHARDQARTARKTMPIGVALIGVGIALSMSAATLPLSLIGTVVVAAIGFVFVPGGVAVLVQAVATIARSNQVVRELGPPVARVVTRS